jgi:hypothetical protein
MFMDFNDVVVILIKKTELKEISIGGITGTF